MTRAAYCQAETIVNLELGTFEFQETKASTTGTLVKVSCPYSTWDSGAEPFPTEVYARSVKDGEEGGGERRCYSIPGNKTHGMWDSFQHKNCRSKVSYND